MMMAERKAAKLVNTWLTWLRCQSVEALPAVRMDMLIKRVGPGKAEVFTLELTELGFSMLTWPAGPPVVFGALLESCFDDVGPTPQVSFMYMCTAMWHVHAYICVASAWSLASAWYIALT